MEKLPIEEFARIYEVESGLSPDQFPDVSGGGGDVMSQAGLGGTTTAHPDRAGRVKKSRGACKTTTRNPQLVVPPENHQDHSMSSGLTQNPYPMLDPTQDQYPSVSSDFAQYQYPMPGPLQNRYPSASDRADNLHHHNHQQQQQQHLGLTNPSQALEVVEEGKTSVPGKRKRHERLSHAGMTEEQSRERNRQLNNEASRFYRERVAHQNVSMEERKESLTLEHHSLQEKAARLERLRDDVKEFWCNDVAAHPSLTPAHRKMLLNFAHTVSALVREQHVKAQGGGGSGVDTATTMDENLSRGFEPSSNVWGFTE